MHRTLTSTHVTVGLDIYVYPVLGYSLQALTYCRQPCSVTHVHIDHFAILVI